MIKGHLEMLILALLYDKGPLHGYGIRQTLTDLSGQVVQPAFGRLYPLLASMTRRGWLKSRLETVCENRKRRVYSITPKGRTELKRRLKKWELFSNGINQVIRHCRF